MSRVSVTPAGAGSLVVEALSSGRMRHRFQPIWDLRSGGLLGFDALPRFRGDTPPPAVWAAASELNAGPPLERIAAHQAVLQARRLPGLLYLDVHGWAAPPEAAREAVAASLHRSLPAPQRLVFGLTPEEVAEHGRDGALGRLGVGLALSAGTDGPAPAERFGLPARSLRFVRLDRAVVALWLAGETEPLDSWVRWARSRRLPVIAAGVDVREAAPTLRRSGVRAVQGLPFGEPAPAARWNPQRLSEPAPPAVRRRRNGAPKAAARAVPPPASAPAPRARRIPAPEEVVAQWRPLYRDGTWISVVQNLHRHLKRLTGADSYALWACLPPHGHWLRVTWASHLTATACLPPGTEPMASVRARVRPLMVPPAPTSPAYRRILDEVGIDRAWLSPLTLPDPVSRSPLFVGILSMGWFPGSAAAQPTAAMHGDELAPVIAYLLGQRIQEAFTETAMEWVASQPTPTTAGEWVPLLEELTERFGGDHWALSAVDTVEGDPVAWEPVAESGDLPGTGAGWSAHVQRFGGALAAAPGLRTAAQGRIDFIGDLSHDSGCSPELRRWQTHLCSLGLRSLLTLPLGRCGDGRTGVMVVYWRQTYGWQRIGASAHPWEALRRLLAGWWREMSSTRDMLHDPLTGVFNRRGVYRAWEANRSPGGVLGILDCDGFHQVNNLWGHMVGDDVLRSMGEALGDEAARHGGWCGRWGGDEFTVGLPGGSDWRRFGRCIQRRLDTLGRDRGWPQRVTVSGGAVRWASPRPGCEAALEFADRALLHAKRVGEGRFRLHRRTLGGPAGPPP